MSEDTSITQRLAVRRALAAVPRPITVKAAHILQGEEKVCDKCPVALATFDAYAIGPHDNDIFLSVGGLDTMDVWFYGEDETVHTQWTLPDKVRNFIRRFDQSIGGLLPFTFTPTLNTVLRTAPD